MGQEQEDIQNTVKRTIEKHFSKGSTFIVGVSGGVDSMTLLNILSHIPEYRYVIVSIDHSIRIDSRKDITLVKHTAQQHNFTFHSRKFAVPSLAKIQRRGLEEAARDIRYKTLQTFQRKYQAAAIMTAHHKNDQVETILFHLIRGSDIHGLVGMEEINKKAVFRPMLTISKEAITEYAVSKGLQWHEDSTNNDTQMSRNFIRKEVAPIFPSELLVQISEQAKKTVAIFDRYIEIWLQENLSTLGKKKYFTRKAFLTLPLYLQFYLVQHITKNIFKQTDFSFSWLSSMYQWLQNSHSNSKYIYKGKVLLINKNQQIHFATQ